MRRKYSSWVIIFFLIGSILGGLFVAFDNDMVVSAANRTVGAGATYSTIQAAIDAASDGDTIYVWAGTYPESINVTKSVDIVGNGTGVTFVEAGLGFEFRVDWINLSNINITKSGAVGNNGVTIYSNNTNVSNCNFNNRWNGVYIYGDESPYDGGDNNSVYNCEISAPQYYGVEISDGASDNTVDSCYINHSNNGVFISSPNEICWRNTVNNCHFTGAYATSVYSSGSNYTTVTNCEMNLNTNGYQVDINSLYPWAVTNIIVSNNNIVEFEEDGIRFDNVNDSYIENNTINEATGYSGVSGILLYTCTGVTIANNTLTGNTILTDGIRFQHSDNNDIFDNTINIWLDGIDLDTDSDSNTFLRNTVTGCDDGIVIVGDSNTIYDNYFSNTDNADCTGSSNTWATVKTLGINILSNPYLGGNYWSDYAGTDTDNDGLGETTYSIDGDDTDSLPLVVGWVLYPPTNVAAVLTDPDLLISWTKGTNGVDTTLIRSKVGGYPSSTSDGTLVQNSSTDSVTDTLVVNTYYTLWSYNSTVNTYSTAVYLDFFALKINVYNESNPSVAVPNWNLVAYDSDGAVVNISTEKNNPVLFDINSFGTGRIYFHINATGYDTRIYYTDIVSNTNYILDAFLPPSTAETYTLIVIGDADLYNPRYINDAEITITRYINSSIHEIASGHTDYSGRYYTSLISGATYFVNITATGYLDSTHTYIPSATDFEHTFYLTSTTPTTKTYDMFWENVSIDIDMVSAGCLQDGNITITYLDSNSSTTNTEIQLWEVYGTTNTLLNTWTNTSNSFFNINGSINTTRMHFMVLFFNNTADFMVSQPITILIPNVDSPTCGKIDPFDLDDRIDKVIGPFTIDGQEVPWTGIIGIIIPLIVLVSFGPFNTGVGIIGCGITMAMVQGFLDSMVSGGFNWAIAGLGVFIIVIGVMYIMTKGTGGDHL